MTFYPIKQIRLHDTTHNPVGLWQFQGDALDSSGNSFDLTWTGTEIYSVLNGPLQAAFFDGSSHTIRNDETDLQILDDITIEMLISYHGGPGLDSTLLNSGVFYMGAAGETLAVNVAYSVRCHPSSSGLRIMSESGSGVDATFDPAGSPPDGTWHHAAFVRDKNVWKVFYNGILIDTSGTLTAPEGGTDGNLYVGGAPADIGGFDEVRASIASLKIISSALSDIQVLAEARLTGFA